MLDLKSVSLDVLIKKLAPALLLLLVGMLCIKLVLKGMEKLLCKSTHIDSMLNRFILSAIRVILWVLLILSVVQQLGFDATSFMTIFAAAGAAIALALKDSLSNLAGGILIMFTKPFVHGDYIYCGEMEGTVDSIDLLYTTIVSKDNKKISIPNAQLTSNSIANYRAAEKRRLNIKIGVSYDCDLEKVKQAILELAQSDTRILKDPAPECNVWEYGDSSIVLLFLGWAESKDYWDTYFYINNHLKETLDRIGAEIPYPQMDVHMR